jgi:hypothetical protein
LTLVDLAALRDLQDRALADSGSVGTTMTGEGVWQAMTTELGRQLLDFVTLFE